MKTISICFWHGDCEDWEKSLGIKNREQFLYSTEKLHELLIRTINSNLHFMCYNVNEEVTIVAIDNGKFRQR